MIIRRNSRGGLGSADWIDVDIAAEVERSNQTIVGQTLYWQTPDNGLRAADFGIGGRVDGDLLVPAGDADSCSGDPNPPRGSPASQLSSAGWTSPAARN